MELVEPGFFLGPKTGHNTLPKNGVFGHPKAGTPIDGTDQFGRTATDIAASFGHQKIAEMFIQKGVKEPALWNYPRVSDEAAFLTFEAVPTATGEWRNRMLESVRNALLVHPDTMVLRHTSLLFWPNRYLLAIEDSGRRGRREQFAIYRPDLDPDPELILLDWTNEPIYHINEREAPQLDDNARAIAYSQFFFHFVRGQLGRFLFLVLQL